MVKGNLSKPNSKSKTFQNDNKTKYPSSPFFLFIKEKRKGIIQTHPKWKTTKIAKELGRQWNNLSDQEKKV
jgi:hypothetical protein